MSARKVDYLLIGGGLASANCARWLREEGADGEVLLVGREPDRPYNRPDCSKGYLRGEETREQPLFRPDEWWSEQHIEPLTRTSVTGLDVGSRTATLSNKDEVQFEQALIATGANVRRLNVGGCELEQIHYLRTLGNSDAIREGVADAEEVVLIGGSFIACEVAASLTLMGKHCTVVMQEQLTFERTLGAHCARFFQELLESHGVRFHPAMSWSASRATHASRRSSRGTAWSWRRTRWWWARGWRRTCSWRRRRASRSASAAACAAPRACRARRRGCSRRGTCANTSR